MRPSLRYMQCVRLSLRVWCGVWWRAVMVVVVMVTVLCCISTLRTPTGSERRNARRIERVREICQRFNLSSPITAGQLQNILVDDTRRVLYCAVPKVASSSWKRVWLRLHQPHLDLSSSPHSSLRSAIHGAAQEHLLIQPQYEDVWKDMLATYKKFMFVRHPVKRLVAAYRDKIEDIKEPRDAPLPAYLNRIINGNNRSQEGSERGVSFSSFVRLISQQEENQVWLWDAHWRPYYQLCNPCDIQYDFIGKFEDLLEDSKHVLEWAGMDGGGRQSTWEGLEWEGMSAVVGGSGQGWAWNWAIKGENWAEMGSDGEKKWAWSGLDWAWKWVGMGGNVGAGGRERAWTGPDWAGRDDGGLEWAGIGGDVAGDGRGWTWSGLDWAGLSRDAWDWTRTGLNWAGIGGDMGGKLGVLPEPIRNTSASTHALKYVLQLSPSLRQALLKKYLIDFLAFDYNFILT